MSDPALSGNSPSTELASLWIGDALGPLEQISALSFLAVGHTLTIYTYTDQLRGVPPGVKVRDAREIMSGDPIVRHRKTGSPALHSDLFRFRLMARTPSVWVDLDLVAKRRLDVQQPYLFGWESGVDVNGAVLRLPPDSPALQALLSYDLSTRGYPPFLPLGKKLKYMVKSLGRGMTIDEWPWGALGPRGLTYHLRACDEISHAQPVSCFYPVPVDQANLFLQPPDVAERCFDAEVRAVHFWGSQLRKIIVRDHAGQIPEGSWMHVQRLRMMNYSGMNIVRTLT